MNSKSITMKKVHAAARLLKAQNGCDYKTAFTIASNDIWEIYRLHKKANAITENVKALFDLSAKQTNNCVDLKVASTLINFKKDLKKEVIRVGIELGTLANENTNQFAELSTAFNIALQIKSNIFNVFNPKQFFVFAQTAIKYNVPFNFNFAL